MNKKIIPYVFIECSADEVAMLHKHLDAVTSGDMYNISAFCRLTDKDIHTLWNLSMPPETNYAGYHQTAQDIKDGKEDVPEWRLGSKPGEEPHTIWNLLKVIFDHLQEYPEHNDFFIQATASI